MSDRGRAAVKALVVAIAILAVDQITKQIVVHSVDVGHPVKVALGIEIANVRNDGVAFGLLAGGGIGILAITLVALGALCFYFYRHPDRRGLWIAVGLLCGGAIANLADRLRSGEVIDFIDVRAWPTFNLADVAIVFGAGILAWVVVSPEEDDEAAD